jgi:MFS family permease
MEVSLLSFLAICAGNEWKLSSAQRASITSLVFVGQLVGSLLWGQLADRYGRKFAYVVACCFIAIGGFLSGVSPSFEWLLVFRAAVGFGVVNKYHLMMVMMIILLLFQKQGRPYSSIRPAGRVHAIIPPRQIP